MTDHIIVVSDNMTHDAKAVKEYTSEVLKFLDVNRGVTVNKVIQFSDGCASQYKSKLPFQHISEMGMPVTRNFFGSRHGKGPCDGIAAVIKTAATRAVKSGRAVIDTPDAFFNYMDNYMSRYDHTHSTSHRAFLFVSKKSTSMQTQDAVHLKTVDGTQHLHSVCSTLCPGEVKVRVLACYCYSCTHDDDEDEC